MSGDVQKLVNENSANASKNVFNFELFDLGNILFFVHDIVIFFGDGVDGWSFLLLLFFGGIADNTSVS